MELLEPSDERQAERDELRPGGVGAVVGEGHAFEAGVFEVCDGVLDAGVGSHVCVELGGVACGVGVEPAVAPVAGVEQGALRSGVQRLAAGDEAGALGPAIEVDAAGEVGDLGALRGPAVGAERRLPCAGVEAAAVYGRFDLVVRARGHEEPDVAVPAGVGDADRAARGVDPQMHLPKGRLPIT